MRRLLLLVLLGLLWPAPLSAQAAPLIVQLVPCAEGVTTLDVGSLLELLRAELAPRELRVDVLLEAGLTIDACQTDLLVLRASGVEPRRLPLHDVQPALRLRVAALAAAELVFEPDTPGAESAPTGPPDWDSSEALPSTAAALSQPAPSAPALRDVLAAPRRQPVGRLVIGGETRLFLVVPSVHIGPRAIFMMKRLELSVVTMFGRHEHALGAIRTGLAAAAVQVPVWRKRRRRDELAISVGAELGASWGGGTPSSSYQTSGATRVGPFLAVPASLSWGGAPRHSAYLRAELGVGYAYGLTGLAQGEAVATTHGPFAMFSAQIGTRAAPR